MGVLNPQLTFWRGNQTYRVLEVRSIMAEQKIILIVDDEALLRGSLSRILKQAGYKVITAEDGQAALESLRQKQVNLILTDLKMPKMDGLQLLKAAKMLSPEIEVIVMTAFGEVATAVEAMQEDAYSFITKPFKRPVILLPIARALEKQTLVRENRFFREKLEAEHHFRNIIGKSNWSSISWGRRGIISNY